VSDVLHQRIYAGGASREFGDLTAEQVGARAAELRSAGGWGPTVRVIPVAMAWAQLARDMERAGAATVAELGEEEAEKRAERLWIVPPGGSLLG
jgi:hypothetical protein